MSKPDIFASHIDKHIIICPETLGRMTVRNSIGFNLRVICPITGRLRVLTTIFRGRRIYSILSEMTVHRIDGDSVSFCDRVLHLEIIAQ
jgi:hypothetical protein